MTDSRTRPSFAALLPALFVIVLVAVALSAACGGKKNVLPANTANPDRYLFDRGTEMLKQRKWMDAREYFRQVVDNYPGSPLRPDTYLGEKSAESLVLAANENREFITFFPTHPRADYAQYKLAMSHYQQMRAPERDQTETVASLKEFQTFFDRYGATSQLTPEVRNQDMGIINTIAENQYGRALAWDFIKSHVSEIRAKQGGSIGAASVPYIGAAGNFCDASMRSDATKYIE